eukprot:g179.t1
MRRQASAIAREAELPKNSFPPGQSIIFKGMLQKKAGFLGKKKFRMFVLTKEWLGYYDMSSGVTLKGSIPLTEITNISEGEKDPNVFNIHSSRKVFHITSPDVPQKDKWVNMINGTRWNLYNSAKDALTNFNSASTRKLMAAIGLLQSGSASQVEQALASIHDIIEQTSKHGQERLHPTLCRLISRRLEQLTYNEKGISRKKEVKDKIVKVLEVVRGGSNDGSGEGNRGKAIASSLANTSMTGTTASDSLKTIGEEIKNTGATFAESYKLIKELGEGAYSVVYEGKHRGTKERVAIKVIKKKGLPQTEYENLTHEVGIMKTLDHPNIVKLIDYFDEEKACYIVTELCVGGELLDYILKDQYSERDAAKTMAVIAKALFYCHKNGIVHRDLKPENVLLSGSNAIIESRIKLADFGFAKSLKFVGLSTACGS